MKRHDQFTWNGSRFRWKQESWPKFTNADDKVRDFYGEVAPEGTAWRATLDVGGMRHKGEPMNTPTEAFEQCRRSMYARLENALGKAMGG